MSEYESDAAGSDEPRYTPSSGTSTATPPPKKTKTKHHHDRKLQYSKKTATKKGKSRKISSSSSGSNGSHESLLDMECPIPRHGEKKACKSKALHAVSNIHRRNNLLGIFKRYNKSLVTMIKSCPTNFSSMLYSKGFISDETWNQVITGQDSQVKKASLLLCDVHNALEINPEMLVQFVRLLKQDKYFDSLAEEIMDDIERIDQLPSERPLLPRVVSGPAVSRYKDYLLYYYHNDPIMRDDKLSIAPCSQFINLALVNKEKQAKKGDTFSRGTFHGGVDEIIAFKSPISMDSVLTLESQFVLVEGPPGIGKSTLCWELCRQWDTLGSLQGYGVVLLLKLRERRMHKASTLNDLFYYRDRRLQREVVEEVTKCEGKGVLLVLDGFDEVPQLVVRDRYSLIMELIGGRCLPLATRLVTSRPSALHRTKYFPQNYRHIEILGFTDEHKLEYAKIAFQSEPEVQAHFMKFVVSNPVINSLMYIPINCAIIAQVYKDIQGEILPKTMTQLYTTLILVLIRRYMIENGIWDEESRIPRKIHDLPRVVLEELKKVAKLAFQGLFKDDVQLVFFDTDIPEGIEYLGLLKESKEMYVSEGVRTSYSFLHLSIQEFLAAWHVICYPDLVSKVMEQSFDELPEFSNCLPKVKPHLSVFSRFVAGMIGCKEFPLKFKIPASKFKYLDNSGHIMSCFYETQDSNYLNSLPTGSFWHVNLSTPLDMYVFGYTLVHAPIQWEIAISTRVEMLLRSIADNSCPSGDQKGCIEGLEVGLEDTDYVIPSLELLPLQSLISLQLTGTFDSLPAQTSLLSAFPKLQRFSLTCLEICENDYLIYQALKHTHLEEIELRFPSMTEEGIQAIVKFLSSNHTLQFVHIVCSNKKEDNSVLRKEWDYHRLIEASLSCPTVKSIETNIPYRYFNNICQQVEKLSFMPFNYHWISSMNIHDCLCNIADVCRIPTLKHLRLDFTSYEMKEETNFVLQDPILILNNSLCYNSSLELELTNFQCNFQLLLSFIRYLQKDPDILIENLEIKRARSLCDLSLSEDELESEDSNGYSEEEFEGSILMYDIDENEATSDEEESENSMGEYEDPCSHLEVEEDTSLEARSVSDSFQVTRSCSCPDLSMVQCGLKMHPALYDKLIKCLVVKPSYLQSPYRNAMEDQQSHELRS